MHQLTIALKQQFEGLKNPTIAKQQSAYMLHQFRFLGIMTPERRATTKAIINTYKITDYEELVSVVNTVWQLPEREFQYAAVEILAAYKKIWQPSIIELIEQFLIDKSWWDSVDHIASECLGYYFLQFPFQVPQVTDNWHLSSNIWLQRSSLMFQKSYKTKTNIYLLEKYIAHLHKSKEFFVQKAIGWALREYSKTNSSWVIAITKKYPLANLSKREALKRLT
ncbi:MAG: DNA alkylation repair protein [Chitinophagaceae bacterium]